MGFDMECKKCGSEFQPQAGLINYCSLKCRNSRIWTEADKRKKSESARKSELVRLANSKKSIVKSPRERIDDYSLIASKIHDIANQKILQADFDTLKFERMRKRLILEQGGKCNRCKLTSWQGENIPLELEHKDGNHKNNERSNLEMLCPNCHALTSTWRGRNKNSLNQGKRISDEVLFQALVDANWNMRQSLLSVGLAAKGGNYKRCHKLKKLYGIIG